MQLPIATTLGANRTQHHHAHGQTAHNASASHVARFEGMRRELVGVNHLQDLPPSSASRADLVRVLGAARRANDVAKKILTFSRELDDAGFASAEQAGAHLVLTKAFESFDLIHAVETVLGVGHG